MIFRLDTDLTKKQKRMQSQRVCYFFLCRALGITQEENARSAKDFQLIPNLVWKISFLPSIEGGGEEGKDKPLTPQKVQGD